MTQTDSEQSPATRQAMLVREVLEDVLLHVSKLPGRIDRSSLLANLEAALTATSALVDSEATAVDHVDKLDAAHAAVRKACKTAEFHEPGHKGGKLTQRLFGAQRALEHCRDATIDSVVALQGEAVEALQRTGRGQRVQVVDVVPLSASRGAPRLFSFERPPLASGVDVAAPDEWIFEDLSERPDGPSETGNLFDDNEVNEAEVAGALEPGDGAKRLQLLVPFGDGDDPVMEHGLRGEIAQLERIARDCFEDIGAMGNLRVLDAGQRLNIEAMKRFEDRILCNTDAVIGLGTPFEMTERPGARFGGWSVLDFAIAWSTDASVPDPARAFARAFLLGSVEGRDTLRAAILALKQSHPHTYPMQVRALAVAPHPGIIDVMLPLLRDDDEQICEVALLVLATRGHAEVGVALPLLEHSSGAVRVAAARCAAGAAAADQVAGDARSGSVAAVIETLTDHVAGELEEEVVVATLESLLVLGSKAGLHVIRQRLEEDLDDPGCLTHEASDQLMLLLGMAGSAKDAELMMRTYSGRRLESAALGRHGNIANVHTLLEALTNTHFTTKKRRAIALALHRITGALTPQAVVSDDLHALPIAPDFWFQWWSENKERFDENVRYRYGVPYTALQSIDELERDGITHADRERSAFELRLLGMGPTVVLTDFLYRQHERTAQLRDTIQTDLASPAPRLAPGAWASVLLR